VASYNRQTKEFTIDREGIGDSVDAYNELEDNE
jgi:hypothetical protein